ncbi:MAG: Smr/MutS family protein, partial [Bdellovibrionales bacterium]|nr:Smr/MutS family protein [Bdellovibrionales bacterium]
VTAKRTVREFPRRTPVHPKLQTCSVDLHGKTRLEALSELERLLDRALLGGMDRLEIIHGLGTGALRDVTHDFLRASTHIRSFEVDMRNPGTTWAYL